MSNLYQNLELLDSDNLSCFLYFYTEEDSEELLFSCAWDEDSSALDKFCYLAYKVLSGELKDTILSVIEGECEKKGNSEDYDALIKFFKAAEQLSEVKGANNDVVIKPSSIQAL